VRATLEPEGLRVTTLSEPLRFWDELERVGPDLVMLDYDMPEVNGLELCRVMRNDSRWAAVPVLFLTSRRDEATVRDVFAAGADDYLLKPVIREELVGRIRSRLERFRLHRLLAERDALTGVRNRPSSTQAIERLIAMARRYAQPLTLAAIDLDRFKAVNDRYGHAAGDAVLRKLGELLLQAFRGEDVVGRWGGEELVVGMYGMSRDDALRRMRGVLASFTREEFTGAEGETFNASFSAGVAALPGDGEDVRALHRAADAALYQAKDAGRCRVQAAGKRRATPADRPDVVVVEDDEALVEVLVHSLETRGHRVRALRDGAEASAALAGPSPDLRPRVLVLDIDLPAVDGVAVLRRLSTDGALRHTSVIVLTGHATEDDVLETLELGAIDHVQKPFSVPVLMHKVAQALDGAGGR
jgi:diguanylate cyclase (GGDEF)-like protein